MPLPDRKERIGENLRRRDKRTAKKQRSFSQLVRDRITISLNEIQQAADGCVGGSPAPSLSIGLVVNFKESAMQMSMALVCKVAAQCFAHDTEA